MSINKTDFSQSAYNHFALAVALLTFFHKRNGTKFIEFDTRIVLRNNRSIGSSITCHTTGVESTERKLCSGLTNSLRCDNADSLAHLNHTTGGKVTTVALHADTMLAFAGEY